MMRCCVIKKDGKKCKKTAISGFCYIHTKNTGLYDKNIHKIFELPKDIYRNVMLYLDHDYVKILCNKSGNMSLYYDIYFQNEYKKFHNTRYWSDKNIQKNIKNPKDKISVKNMEIIKSMCKNFDSEVLFMDPYIFDKTCQEQWEFCEKYQIPIDWLIYAKKYRDIHLISKVFIQIVTYTLHRHSFKHLFGHMFAVYKPMAFYCTQLMQFDYTLLSTELLDEICLPMFNEIFINNPAKINNYHKMSTKSKIKIIKVLIQYGIEHEDQINALE